MTATSDRQLTALSELAGLVAGGVTRRSQLATATGLSRAAVAQRVDLLIAKGLLVETGTVATERGRPPLTLQLASAGAVVCAVDLGATHSTVAVADLGGTVLAEATEDLDINDGPEAVLTGLHKQLSRLLDSAGHPADHVRAISIGLPGPVEASTGTVIRPPIMRGWDGYRVPSFFADRYRAPVLADNDVNMMALGEYGHRPAAAHLLYVKVGTGIGCGIVSGGVVHRGATGAAGDIGHIRVPGHDEVLCRCGNTGCVEAVASGAAIAATLREAGLPAEHAADVVRLVAAGDPLARRQVRLAAQRLGDVIASLVSFYNPDTIVLGGSIASLHDDLLADIRAAVYRRALPLATRTVAIETTLLGRRAGIEGARRLAVQHLLSPEGIGQMLADAP
ncbi:ROK family protein [Streptomyces cocklensis]|uniref:Sugar kinase of the NBD/HSP70 family, may contain an N-terminal HTH domain n=1 Tax=Actinacidiphila cocklensis TaxID=887465 RepID=A0A9W4E2J9_9ACTN|nr:ROK family transcriptional regulator [Actinacidiphila cocklensis]MDD1059071.1 ROK family protein [Actinacidiphila cocklensis]WSX73411.1 ROK family protein [Streptomyces sp. NBC_00899]WSX80523.1 ROK family protein [Streptomyces sp. NBC_00899]CAG6398272.1 Sugar kinase of the NBD/HSP70 family, may contain an N-terminal HTH domain [Actinacidiphila cocklensis]